MTRVPVYGKPSDMDYSQAGAYVVKILKGEQPLPLMQPAKFDLVHQSQDS
jgi:hypothetical protein